MKKFMVALMAFFLCLSFCSCTAEENDRKEDSDKEVKEERLEGYYAGDGNRYCFEITEYGTGDYGGTLTDLTDTTNVSVWSIEDKTVYVNGDGGYDIYYFSDAALYYEEFKELSIIDNHHITGEISHYNGGDIENIVFYEDGTIEYDERYVYSTVNKVTLKTEKKWSYHFDCKGSYLVEDNRVYVYLAEDEEPFFSLYIVDGRLFERRLTKI